VSQHSDEIPLCPTTPAHGTVGPLQDLENRIGILVIQVDRLQQTNKLLRWAAATATAFALGSAIAVAKTLYGFGAEDATIRNGIERAQRQADEIKSDVRELQKFVYHRFGADTPRLIQPTKDDQP